ncbi:hypothetical protein [Atlantibacter hermannii]|uniref:hypothetical protein n=1 Tax=Atlantibacter hermannii TaxID=565 RepID=UPI0028982EFF|nr:hypothetical protein [Atlantibacter hermannii]
MSEILNGIALIATETKKALLADIQYLEPYASAAFNRKMKSIVKPGFYEGFMPALAGGMDISITSGGGDEIGAASVDVGISQISIHQLDDVILTIPAGATTLVVLEGNYQFGVKTNQVDNSSPFSACGIFLADASYSLADNQLEVCRLIVPPGAKELSWSMVDMSHRRNRTVGVELSDEIDLDNSFIAASAAAVKKAVEAAKQFTEKAIDDLNLDQRFGEKAPIFSPEFTGSPLAPTPQKSDSSQKIATTAFVKAAITALVDSSPEALDTLSELAAALGNDPNFATTMTNLLATKAPLASPALTGTPTAPTADQSVSNTQLATTAFVKAAITALVGASPSSMDTLEEIATALGNDPNFATTMTNLLAAKAPLASPALTGTPTAPTPAKTDNTTKLATTGHVKQVVADYAPLASPALSGKPTAPTALQTSNDTQLATTAFVKAAITALVDSSPAALDTLSELAAALGNDPNFATTMTNLLAAKAPLASPALTGTPTAPTPAKTDNTTKLATTGHVKQVVADYAPLASPALSGKPTAPTALQTSNDTQLATTAFVKAAITALVDSSPAALDTLSELAAALGNDPNFATTMTNLLATKAPLASPALTGTPTAPTASQTVNNTQLATTAFVKTAVAALLASPTFTGTPTAPTASQSVNNTQIATTAFVKAAIASLVDSSPAALDTLNELAAALNDDPNFASTMATELSKKMDKDANGGDIPNVAQFLINLGLKSAAKRDVGTGSGQIPDMSAFEYVGNVVAGYVKLPNGFKLQWLETPANVNAGTTSAGYWAYPFTTCLFAIAVPAAFSANVIAGNVVAGNFSGTAVEIHNWGQIAAPARIIGIGR